MIKFILLLLVLCAAVVQAQTFRDFRNRLRQAPESSRPALIDSFMNAAEKFPLVESDTVVHYLFRGNAASVRLAGDVNHWQPVSRLRRLPGTDLWLYSDTLPAAARLDYKLVLDRDIWILDPLNPDTIPSGYGPNSELAMPDYRPAPEIRYRPDIHHGTLADTLFPSRILGNSRMVKVYLPPGYRNSAQRYPLILFHDGLEYLSLAKAKNVLDNLIADGRIRPLIAVFVPPVNRTPEYAGELKDEFAAFIMEELLPWVDARFRTSRQASERAMIGASNGGNISLWIALRYPGSFGHVAAQSSRVEEGIRQMLAKQPDLQMDFYLDMGTYDIPQLIPQIRGFQHLLAAEGYRYRYFEYPEGHSWGNWRAHLDTALEMFFPLK